MTDALLHAVRDALRTFPGADYRTTEIMAGGEPPEKAGDVFVAVNAGDNSSGSENSLDERYGFSVTLSMRARGIPYDRLGDQLMAKKVNEELGFDGRVEALKVFLHMAWNVLQVANNYLATFAPDGSTVYGFCEPARFANAERPVPVGPEWWRDEPAESEEEAVGGLKAELRFEGARRVQAISAFT